MGRVGPAGMGDMEKDKAMRRLMGWLASAAAVASMLGCSVIRQSASTEGAGTNLVRHTSLTVKTLGDAKQVVESLRASNGATHSLGASGVAQESTSEVLQNLVQLAVMAARASSGLPPVAPGTVPQALPVVPIPSATTQGPPMPALAPAAPNPPSKR